MQAWAMYTAAFSAVVLQAWAGRKNSPNWYLGCVIPLLYGAVVAWMFVGADCARAFQIVVFGAAIPISLLLSAWWHRRRTPEEREEDSPSEKP